MTSERARQALVLAAAGCSVRGIADELHVSRRQVERALEAGGAAESPAPPPELIELPALSESEAPSPEAEPARVEANRPRPEPPLAAEAARLAELKAAFEADGARDAARGHSELHALGVDHGRHPDPPPVDRSTAAISARRAARTYSPLRDALRVLNGRSRTI